MEDRGNAISRRQALAGIGVIGFGWLAQGSNWAPLRRQELLARIDPIARQFNKYTAYELAIDEFVGYLPEGKFQDELRDHAYEINMLSAAKFHPESGFVDDWSLRRVDSEQPQWQWHIHLWERAGGSMEVFSHYELRPDPRPLEGENIPDMRDRIREHYNPTWDTNAPDAEATYFLGDMCDVVADVVAPVP